MTGNNIKLSQKFADFLLYNNAKFEVLEGTTASGKTTVGMIKFILMKVMQSDKKQHIIAGYDVGTIEKNIINADLGVMTVFGDYVKYVQGRSDKNSMAHLTVYCDDGTEKIVYLLGYGNEVKWKKALGGQYGCAFIDEINIASMSFVRQVAMRCDYVMSTLNPDDPDKEIYREFINRCRPLPEYTSDTPVQILNMLNEPEMEDWIYWYFTFEHNDGLSEEKKKQIKTSYTQGTADYMHYILGLRGKTEGLIFDNFNAQKHLVKFRDVSNLIKKGLTSQEEYFVQFSAGLDTSYSKNSDDTIAMSFVGITNKRNLYLLDERVLNNKTMPDIFSPSIIVKEFIKFLDKNKEQYGFARDVFIDSADQATLSELKVYTRTYGSIYNFNNAWKHFKILDRIQLQKRWFATGNFFILDTCTNYINELLVYSWDSSSNNTAPEDKNDHMINSVQYAFIPYIEKIGVGGHK